MKSLSLGIAAAVALASLTACGGGDADPKESKEKEASASVDPNSAEAGDSMPEESGTPSDTMLMFEKGSALSPLPAPNKDGVVTGETPVKVAFDSLTCGPKLAKAGFNESFETADLVADAGNQVCLVGLAVTNIGKAPNFFGADDNSVLLTKDSYNYSVTEKDVDSQGIAHRKGQEPSETSDLIQPGQTKYNYVVFELPADKEPQGLVFDITTYED